MTLGINSENEAHTGKPKKREDKSPKRKKGKPAKEKTKALQPMLSPIKNLVDRVTRQDHKHRDRQKGPRTMEPAHQIDPKSQIGVVPP